MSIRLSATWDGPGTGAEQRFQSLFQRHHLEVFRYCARRLDRSDAEDAAAEVFAVAWRRLEAVPEGEGSRAWLIGVAYKVVGNQYRSRRRRGRLVDRLRTVPAEPTLLPEAGEGPAVIGALADLRPGDQEILRLSAWDGLSNPEIAQVLHISENAVAQRLFRARARLKDRYEARTSLTSEEHRS